MGKSFDDSIGTHLIHFLEPLLLTRNNFNPSMNKKSQVQSSAGGSDLSISKLQWLHHWSLGMDK